MKTRTWRPVSTAAALVSAGLLMAACSSGGASTEKEESAESGGAAAEPAENSSGEDVTITVGIFGNGGYEGDADGKDNLFRLYEEQNPGVKIEEVNQGQGGDALTIVLNAVGAAGVGLPDVQMIEEGWRGQIGDIGPYLVDLTEYGANDIKDRWVPWKWEQTVDEDGKVWGYGTDIGPQGLCFDKTMVEQAGIAKDRDEFAAALGGKDATWEKFWEVGKQYTDATGKPWLGVPAFAMNSFVNQLPEGYYKSDGSLNVDQPEIKEFLSTLVEQSQAGVAGKINAWDWNNEDFHGNFAVQICPGWMLGSISEAVQSGDDVWDFADVFPGGATNWGGSYFAVSTVAENTEAAAKLADWLTAPEQQAIAFKNAGAYPSQVEAQKAPDVISFKNELFNDAPVGEILAKRAEGVVAQYKGPQDSVIQDTVMGGVISEINAGQITTGDQAWDRFNALLAENDIK